MDKATTKQDEPTVVIGSREQLLHLLAEASEIEHTLMCSYLYAAFSLKRAGEEGLTEPEGQAVERWRRVIMDVAVQEMGHLLMVANLTVAVGGRPHFARPNFPVSPGYFPAGVVVRLSGFSVETLDHFIFLERPSGIEVNDADGYVQKDYARDHAQPGLMPSAQDYTTIAHLYEAIRQNLEALAQRLGEPGLFIGGAQAQVGPEVVELEGVTVIQSLADAARAIDLIVEQGEGSPSDREVSHYQSFIEIRRELGALCASNPAFVPAWPVAQNPVLRQPPEREDKVFISHPQAATLLDFACATYGLLLRVLGQAFARSKGDILGDQKTLIATAFDLMHGLGTTANQLARLPSQASSHIHAGMSFTMLRGVEPLLGGAAEATIMREQFASLGNATLPDELTGRMKLLASEFQLSSEHLGER